MYTVMLLAMMVGQFAGVEAIGTHQTPDGLWHIATFGSIQSKDGPRLLGYNQVGTVQPPPPAAPSSRRPNSREREHRRHQALARRHS